MRNTLQGKYDALFQPGWRPPLQSRRDLLTWACGQYNNMINEKELGERNLAECENYGALVGAFGPDYDRLRPKLGYMKGLFD